MTRFIQKLLSADAGGLGENPPQSSSNAEFAYERAFGNRLEQRGGGRFFRF